MPIMTDAGLRRAEVERDQLPCGLCNSRVGTKESLSTVLLFYRKFVVASEMGLPDIFNTVLVRDWVVYMKPYICLQIKLDYVMLCQHELETEFRSLEAQPSTRSTARRRKVRFHPTLP